MVADLTRCITSLSRGQPSGHPIFHLSHCFSSHRACRNKRFAVSSKEMTPCGKSPDQILHFKEGGPKRCARIKVEKSNGDQGCNFCQGNFLRGSGKISSVRGA